MQRSKRPTATVLVVDDNPSVLKLLGPLFEEAGMAVVLAGSVAEARAALEARSWAFDLVLSDIRMPRETGFDLLEWIKRDGSPKPDIPVLLTTAELPEAENRVKGLAMGAVDYVVRPIELSELVLRVAHAVEHFQRVKALETSLQDSENLAMVGRLLAASHHEIKNIAMLVGLSADRAAKCFGPGADAKGAETLKALSQSTALLDDVSRSVGSLLNPEAATGRPVEIGSLIREVVELMSVRARPNRVEADVPAEPLWTMAHEVRVKQVLINLVLNACDAIAELQAGAGGLVRMSVRQDEARCVITVTDDGIGFEPAGERADFKPFATTKKLRGGQGLGLWLCATLARNMGGTLTLKSDGVGSGATATLTLATASKPDLYEIDLESYLEDV